MIFCPGKPTLVILADLRQLSLPTSLDALRFPLLDRLLSLLACKLSKAALAANANSDQRQNLRGVHAVTYLAKRRTLQPTWRNAVCCNLPGENPYAAIYLAKRLIIIERTYAALRRANEPSNAR